MHGHHDGTYRNEQQIRHYPAEQYNTEFLLCRIVKFLEYEKHLCRKKQREQKYRNYNYRLQSQNGLCQSSGSVPGGILCDFPG